MDWTNWPIAVGGRDIFHGAVPDVFVYAWTVSRSRISAPGPEAIFLTNVQIDPQCHARFLGEMRSKQAQPYPRHGSSTPGNTAVDGIRELLGG